MRVWEPGNKSLSASTAILQSLDKTGQSFALTGCRPASTSINWQAMEREVHMFENGVRVYADHLIPVQQERYAKRNVHEMDEEDLFTETVRVLPMDACFVNIGSAIGYYPILAKRLSPTLCIHAVEPLERHRAFFLENIQLNGFTPGDFIIHTEGISSANGQAIFIDKGFGSVIDRTNKSKRNFKTFVVKTLTLDCLLARIGRVVDLLLMDIQGFEWEALQGASIRLQQGDVKRFFIGTHGCAIHERCRELIRTNGYTIRLDQSQGKNQPDGILFATKNV
jgi:FkbM family methyltransferase